MKRAITTMGVLSVASALFACGGGATENNGTDGGTSGTDSGVVGADTGPTDTSRLLIGGSWTLPPSTENYVCVRVTVPEEMFVNSFIPTTPRGTHHTVLTIAPHDGTPDGTVDCNGFVNGPDMLYGSGVGTDSLVFPQGIAVRIPAGAQLLLNLHLYNSSTTETLNDTSGIRVTTLDASEVVHEAEIVLAGKDEGLNIPPRQVTTQTGYCTFAHAQTVFSVFPHMHQTATHMTVSVVPASGAETTVLDTEYSFDDQTYRPIAPTVELGIGDRIRVDCTYDNPTSRTIHFGESSEDEMCYAGIYRYPASRDTYVTCTL
jgi:hypothetical protein